jgi:hypothetical protein
MEILVKLLKIAVFVLICYCVGKFVLWATRSGPFLKKSMNEERYDVLVWMVGFVAFCLSIVGLVYVYAWFDDVL